MVRPVEGQGCAFQILAGREQLRDMFEAVPSSQNTSEENNDGLGLTNQATGKEVKRKAPRRPRSI